MTAQNQADQIRSIVSGRQLEHIFSGQRERRRLQEVLDVLVAEHFVGVQLNAELAEKVWIR